jgi:uncharacterized protein (DUF2237 family)
MLKALLNAMNPSSPNPARNVLGERLEPCCFAPLTGFFRDGCCRTAPGDVGVHTVCAVMTKDFLEFTVAAGNDLVTPRPEWDFPGLVVGEGVRLGVHQPRIHVQQPILAQEALHLDAPRVHRLALHRLAQCHLTTQFWLCCNAA